MLFNNSSDGSYQIGGSVKRHNFNDSFLLTCHQTNNMASAKQIRDEIMRMTIVVNSNPAQQEIYNLTEANRKFALQSTKLREERVKVGQSLGKNSQQYKDLTAQINSNSALITANNKKIKDLADTLDISQMSVKQLKQEAVLLRRELERVVPGSNQYNALQTQLGAVNGRLAQVRGGAAATSSSFGSLASQFNHYSGIITAGVAMFVGFGLSIQAVIDRNNKLVDAQTAVGKTVNMTKEEVEDLTKTFSAFDTRTSKIDLLKIAETGGRLGVGKAQIKDFVQEVDKANVALGDGFAGGVEAVTDTLGKLKNLYGETKDLDMATAINQIGSAMNELGANGAATEANIGEFALRLGSLPAKLKPTIAEALALGAAFEESGIDAERAGTAYSTFVRNAATNADKFAKVMGISKKEVEDLMNADPLEFFLKFSEGMKGMDTTDLAKTMEFLKMNDQYVISTMGAASENTEKFRASIELSNKSLTEATSLQNEFNKVNNNSAAVFEKVQKKFLGMFTSQKVADTLNWLIGTFALFLGVNKELEGRMGTVGKSIVDIIKVFAVMASVVISASLGIAVYNTLIKESVLRTVALDAIEKIRLARLYISTAVQSGYNVVLGLGQIALGKMFFGQSMATAGQLRLNAAMASNPIGAVVLAITALVGILYILKQRQDEARISEKERYEQLHRLQTIENQSKEEGVNAVKKYKEGIENLIYVIKSETSTKKMRESAYKSLIKIHPQFLDTVDKEFRATKDLIRVYNELASQIDATARAKAKAAAKQSIYDQIEKDRVNFIKGQSAREKEQQNRNDLRKQYSYSKERGNSAVEMFGSFEEHNKGAILIKSIADNENLIKQISTADKKRIDVLKKAIETAKGNKRNVLEIELNSLLGISNENQSATTPNFNVPGDPIKTASTPKPKSTTSADNQHKKEMDDAERRGVQAEELARQIALNIEDAKIEAMEEGFEKELAALNLQEQRKLAEIDKKKTPEFEIKALDEKIANAKEADKYFYETLKTQSLENNASAEKEKEAQKTLFEIKRKTLNVKYQNEEFKEIQEYFQKGLNELERQKNEELAGFKDLAELKASLKGRANDDEIAEIETWEQGKAALSKVYQKKELEMQATNLQAMLALYEGLDLSKLTKEQQDQVLKFIDDAKNKVAELKAVQNSTDKGGKGKGDGNKSKLGGKGSTDILGMSVSDWDTFFTNIETGADKLGTIIAAVQAVQAAFGLYYQYVQANEQRQMQEIDLNARKQEKRLKKMLDSGQINQEQYEQQIQKLNDETELKKAKLEYEGAKRKRAMSIAEVAINTAVAIMGIWKDFPKVDFGATAAIMSGVVGALGVAQIATIAATPLPPAPGYEDGFGMEYDMRRSQDGKKFRVKRKRLSSGEVHSPTHFIAGERGTEMVIDSPTYTRFRPEVKRILHNEISYAKGFEGGMFRNSNSSSSSNYDEKLMQIIEQNTMAMNAIRDKKFIAYLAKNMDNAKEIIEMTDEFNGYKKSSIKK